MRVPIPGLAMASASRWHAVKVLPTRNVPYNKRLIMWIFVGYLQIVQILLDAGEDATMGLKEAICNHRTDIVRLLLASGAAANVNASDGDALATAVKMGHLELVNVLLEAGADPLICSGESMKSACHDGSLSI